MPAIAPPLAIPPEDLHTLGQWSRSGGIRAALAERAKILLLAAQGTSNTEIAHQVGCSRPTVILWRHRYTTAGLDGLLDKPRPGRPQTVRRGRRAEILAVTLSPPPQHLGVTHWSSRLLADQLGVSHNTVARVWAEHDLKPWRTETFKFSTDPQLEAKVRDVVGLYLDPPERAIVVCVDEKSQIQALARTAPNLPLRPGSPSGAPTTPPGTGRPPCSQRWRWRPVASPTSALTATATVSSSPSSSWWPRPTRGDSCTWCWTTTAPTPTPRSRHGWPATQGSTGTSPRPRRVG
jgi:transposase